MRRLDGRWVLPPSVRGKSISLDTLCMQPATTCSMSDLDTLDFPDQFGRPRLADGSLPPISVFVHIVLVGLDTMEVLDDDEQRWVDSGRRVGWQEWTPECVQVDQTRRGSMTTMICMQ